MCSAILASLGVVIVGLSGVASAVPQELIEGLGDESYELREKSEKDLMLWAKEQGKKGVSELDRMKEKVQSPEVKSRLDNVISKVGYKAIPGTRGFMGITMNGVMGGSVISGVTQGTPAEKAGLKLNDKIIELDGIDLTKKNQHVNEATDFLRAYVQGKKAGEKLTVRIERDGEKLTKELKLADYDESMKLLRQRGDGGIELLPMPGGLRGNMRVIPQLNLNPRQLKEKQLRSLELRLKVNERLLGTEGLADDIKDLLKQNNDANQKKIDELTKELKEENEK